MGDRFRNWRDQTLFDKATGGYRELSQLRLRPNETGFNLGKDVGKSDTFTGSLVNLAQGKWDEISDKGIDKLETFFDSVRLAFKGPQEARREAALDAWKGLRDVTMRQAGIVTPQEMYQKEVERRDFAEQWTRLHSGWWKTESTHGDWSRSDKTNIKDDQPEQKLP
jgi:hypothetical protein